MRFAQFGSGVGIIHLDNVQCDGSELRLANCSHLGVGVHNCVPSEDAGVICSPGNAVSDLESILLLTMIPSVYSAHVLYGSVTCGTTW